MFVFGESERSFRTVTFLPRLSPTIDTIRVDRYLNYNKNLLTICQVIVFLLGLQGERAGRLKLFVKVCWRKEGGGLRCPLSVPAKPFKLCRQSLDRFVLFRENYDVRLATLATHFAIWRGDLLL